MFAILSFGVPEFAQLADLSHARTRFEACLHEKYGHHVASMMMGDGNEAYFPVGTASHRYLLQQIQGTRALRFQVLTGTRAKTMWSLQLADRHGERPASGTLRRTLWDRGYALGTGRLTKPQRIALGAQAPFAVYTCYGPGTWMAAGFLRADGTETGWDVYFDYPGGDTPNGPLYRPIVAEEAAYLGFPGGRWHGPGPLAFVHVPSLHDVADAPVQKVP